MSNISTVNKNQLSKTTSSTLSLQRSLVDELDKTSKEMGVDFSEYGKKCVINAIGGLISVCSSQDISLSKLNTPMLKLALQNIGYTELNYSSMPSEIYFDIRKDGNDSYICNIKPQGAGNEKLVRKYGVGLKKDTGLKPCWIVREGDDFTFPSFDGLNVIPPKWTPKSYDKKPIMVVYPAEKIDGSVEYLIATREGVKPNIIAQIRQNSLDKFKSYNNGKYYVDKEKRDAFYNELNAFAENHSVDELLTNETYAKYINPTYTSGGSKEAMILRKMKNNALKNYPKEYDNAYIRNAVENMFEEKDESVLEKPKKLVAEIDAVEKVESDINESVDESAVQDFKVDDEGVVDSTLDKENDDESAADEKTAPDKKDETSNSVSIDDILNGVDDYGF